MSNELDKINRLKSRLAQQYKEKEEYGEKEKKRTARDRLIDSEPKYQREMHFYCHKHGDFIATGGKVVASDWSNPGQRIAWYEAFGHADFVKPDGTVKPGRACKAIRRITDKLNDPFFYESKMLAKLRIDMADDLLQPDDPRFKQVYGDPYKEYHAKLEEEERLAYEKKKQR